MNRLFYQKLAAQNIRRNAKTYVPYILTCMCTVAMFFICMALNGDPGISDMNGGGSVKSLLSIGTIVIGIFSAIFLFYTNSFLIKRRKKEIGLYNVLGMEKRHISIVLFWESLYVFLLSFVLGIAGGLLFQRLVYLLLLKLLKLPAPMQFHISAEPILYTLLLFAAIFALILLNTLRQIQLAQPIELMREASAGEREPKTRWILTIFGLITLGAGYVIALAVDNPIDALGLFFVAVLLVIAGTYSLFIAGSITLLKALRKNKSYYYQPKHFVSVSGMIYRMKQNAVGLANICILSTAVLVMLSSTVSLYLGMEDIIRVRFPRNLAVYVSDVSQEEAATYRREIEQYLEQENISAENKVEYVARTTLMAERDGIYTHNYEGEANISICFVTLEEYNRISGANETLKNGQALLYDIKGSIEETTMRFDTMKLEVVKRLDQFPVDGITTVYMSGNVLLVVPDTDTIGLLCAGESDEADIENTFSYRYMFDTSAPAEAQAALKSPLNLYLAELDKEIHVRVESAEESRASMYGLYGGLFFLGIFLGLLFLIATVLIMYYKQVSEGYEDKARYRIMRSVGMSRQEVRKSIRSQVLTVFFIPLGMAVLHIAVAFPIITKLLQMLNLYNTPLFFWCTLGVIGVFAVFYVLVYSLTARAYYRIVG